MAFTQGCCRKIGNCVSGAERKAFLRASRLPHLRAWEPETQFDACEGPPAHLRLRQCAGGLRMAGRPQHQRERAYAGPAASFAMSSRHWPSGARCRTGPLVVSIAAITAGP